VSNFLTTSSAMTCPHGGSIQSTSANSRAKAGGDFIVRSSDTFVIAGCSFMLGTNPHPCVRVEWPVATQRNKAAQDQALTESSVGFCYAGDNMLQGAVMVSSTESQASGL
jgi:hypothetical protein